MKRTNSHESTPKSTKASSRGITAEQHKRLAKANKRYTLRSDKDAPQYLRELYVYSGYRVNLSFDECVSSLFDLYHNESVNVWTSLLGVAVFVVFGGYLAFSWLPANSHSVDASDIAVFAIYISAAIFAFLSSAIFHLFSCMSAAAYSNTSRLDYTGIATLIGARLTASIGTATTTGSFYPPLYYGFYCEPTTRFLYLGMITVLSGLCIAMFLIPRYTGEKYRALRTYVFGATALSGLLPIVHLVWSRGGIEHSDMSTMMFYVFVMYALYTIGALFYLLRIPERFLPGKCDIFFHSHQFWHLFVLAATFLHAYNCVLTFEAHKRSPGGCFGHQSLIFTADS